MIAPRRRIDARWWLLSAIVVFSTLSLWINLTSSGFLEADGITHVNYARATLTNIAYLFDFWGRPFKTLLVLPGVWLGGVTGVRLTSLTLAIACAVVAWRIAKKQHWPRPAMAGVFVLLSPLLLLHSASELTEIPFAFLLGISFLAYQSRQWMLLAFLVGLLPAARPEGLGAVPLMAVVLACHRKWHAIPLLIVPLLAWDVLGWHFSGQPGQWWRWLPAQFPYSGESAYGRKNPLVYAALMPVVIGPLLLLPLGLGLVRQLRRSRARQFFDSHRVRCEVCIALIPLGLTLFHALLTATGKLGSNGEIRYLVIVAPFWGLLCYRGYVRMTRTWHEGGRAAFMLGCLVAPLMVHKYYPCLPLVNQPEAQNAVEIAKWYERWDRRANFRR